MRNTTQKPLPSLEMVLKSYPLTMSLEKQVQQDRTEIQAILAGKDSRLLIIVGPCSAWPFQAVLAYAERLAALSQAIKDSVKIVMRVYTQKSRTRLGWRGALIQPDPFLPEDITAGIFSVRKLMRDIVQLGLPIVDEIVSTHLSKYSIDLLSYATIGARSSENQEHRIFASLLDCAVGLKNPTHGELSVAVNSVYVAQQAHAAAFFDSEIKTTGNSFAHLILRGSNACENYSEKYLDEVLHYFNQLKITHPAVLIDASHDNSLINNTRNPYHQEIVINHVMKIMHDNKKIKKIVKGFMIESFLLAGRQNLSQPINLNGLSITDACLDWEETEKLLLKISRLICHAH